MRSTVTGEARVGRQTGSQSAQQGGREADQNRAPSRAEDGAGFGRGGGSHPMPRGGAIGREALPRAPLAHMGAGDADREKEWVVGAGDARRASSFWEECHVCGRGEGARENRSLRS